MPLSLDWYCHFPVWSPLVNHSHFQCWNLYSSARIVQLKFFPHFFAIINIVLLIILGGIACSRRITWSRNENPIRAGTGVLFSETNHHHHHLLSKRFFFSAVFNLQHTLEVKSVLTWMETPVLWLSVYLQAVTYRGICIPLIGSYVCILFSA